MSDAEGQAAEYIAQAEKAMKGSFFSRKPKYNDAAEFYGKAANQFKLLKKWSQAAEAFDKAAECHYNDGSKYEAATNYVNASVCYKKVSGEDGVSSLVRAVELYLVEGRFSMAAKYEKEIAELFESNGNIDAAIEHFQKAADHYEGENSPIQANQCLLKVAEFSAQKKSYARAIEVYEQVAKASREGAGKWKLKDYLFMSGLCHYCLDDLVAAKRALERYKELDYTFSGQRECKLLEQISSAYEAYDVDAFTNAIADFDSVVRLNPLQTALLLTIKKAIQAAGGGGAGGDGEGGDSEGEGGASSLV